MSIDVLRSEVMQQLAHANENDLLRVREILAGGIDLDEGLLVPQQELRIAYARRDAYLRGEGQSYSREEAHRILRQKRA